MSFHHSQAKLGYKFGNGVLVELLDVFLSGADHVKVELESVGARP